MKRFHTLMTMVAIAMLSFTFTSCDEDEEIAYTLEGTWKGNIYVSHKWKGQYYDAYYSYIYFDRDPYRNAKGTGYWVDEYRDAPWGDYFASRISWRVINRKIDIYFEDDDYDVTIYDYSLSEHHFVGYIDTYDNKKVRFDLVKTSSPNWSNYHYGWEYWGYDYYAKQSGFEGTRASSADVEKPQRVFRVKE